MYFKFLVLILLPIMILSCAQNATLPPQSSTDQVGSSGFSKSFDALTAALNQNDFNLLEPFLSEYFSVPGVPAALSKTVIKQVVEGYNQKINSYEITQISREKSYQRVNATFSFKDEKKHFDFLLTDEGNFLEINIFKAMQKKITQVEESNVNVPVFMQIPFTLSSNLITVEAELDGRKGYFIVDSGAPQLVLNSKHFESEEVNSVAGLGVSGIITGTNLIQVNNFKWQDFEMQDFEAITMDLSHLEAQLKIEFLGLIGQAELANFEVIYDYQNKMMLCFKLDDSGNKITNVVMAEALIELAVELNSHIPIITAEIGNRKYRFGIDTGAETNLLSDKYINELSDLIIFSEADTLVGANRQKQEVKAGTLKKCLIAAKEFNDMKVVFSDISHLNEGYGLQIDGLLGYEFLSRQKTAINYKKKKLYLW